MKIIALKCPSCNANVDPIPGKNITFCPYCGTKLLIDDESKHEYHHEVNEAKVKASEALNTVVNEWVRKREYNRQVQEHNRQMQEKYAPITIIICIIIIVLCIINYNLSF